MGEGLLDPTTTHGAEGSPSGGETPSTSPAATGNPSTPTVPPPDASGPRNVSVRDDPSGFRLRLTVGDHVRFSTDAVIPLQLAYENRSDRILVVDSDPQLSFVMRDKSGADRWRDDDCRTAGVTGDDTPGYGLAPGESAEMVSTYPYDERFSRRGGTFDASKCNLPPGHYDVLGVLRWCAADRPDEPGPNAANHCADGTTKILLSAPVSIELVDS